MFNGVAGNKKNALKVDVSLKTDEAENEIFIDCFSMR